MSDTHDQPSSPPPSPGLTSPRSRRNLWLAGLATAAALSLGIWLVATNLTRWLNTPATPAADEPKAATDIRRIHATLFYVSSDGMALVPVSREVLYGATPAEQVRHLVAAASQAPPPGLMSAIPAGTQVRSVFLTTAGEAYIDFTGPLVTAHTGGSLDEALTVYAIVDVVTVNLTDISGVQILVDGKQVDTLVGHLDLRYPLTKSLEWIRKGTQN